MACKYTWNRRCEFPNHTPAYQILNSTSQKQRMPGVRDNDPVSVCVLFTFGSICFSDPFCKFIYLNF